MNIIKEKRENIIRENNNAQEILESILANMSASSHELIVLKSLYGDIDLSILEQYDLRNINKVVFSVKGNITNLLNIPETVKYLVCKEQLLETITLPHSIEYLDLEQNYLETIDLSKCAKLKYANLNNNKIEKFDGNGKFPKTLEELYVNYNLIRLLDFTISPLPSLKVLHCVGNNMLSIRGIPSTITDLRIEENPLLNVEYGDTPNMENIDEEKIADNVDKKYSFIEALNKYFSYKEKYETELLNKKKAVLRSSGIERGKKPPKKIRNQLMQMQGKCIKCQRQVGTIFSMKNETYYAVCGDKVKPCNLNYTIYAGSHSTINDILDVSKRTVDIAKEKIICNKYDMIFQYVDEKKSMQIFKDLYSEFSIFSNNYKKYLDKYNSIYNNEHNRELYNNQIVVVYELRNKLNEMLKQYKEYNIEGETSKKHKILKELVYLYDVEFLPEMHKLTNMKYKMVEMVDVYGRGISAEMETREYDMPELLRLKELRLDDIEERISDEPRVVKWT